MKWSEKMKKWTAGLSDKTLLMLLIVFVLLTGSFFGYVLYSSFKNEGYPEMEVIAISKTILTKDASPGIVEKRNKTAAEDSLCRDLPAKESNDPSCWIKE